MDHQISPECTYAASGSHEPLLPEQQSDDQTTTAFYSKRALKRSNEECCVRKTSSLLNLKEIKDTLHARLCQRSTSNQMVCGVRIPSPRPQQKDISPLPVDISIEPVTLNDQAGTIGKSRITKDKKSQPEKELEIGSLKIIDSLEAIIKGEGIWEKITHSLIRCCADLDQGEEDKEWLDYMSVKIRAIDENPKKYWNYCPRALRSTIQEIIYTTVKTFHRYKGSMPYVNPEHLKTLNNGIQQMLKKYYQKFGEELFCQILDPDTCMKRTMTYPSQYSAIPWYHYDIIPKTLTRLLAPSSATLAYLPVLWALKNEVKTIEKILGFDAQAIQEMAARKEQQRLLKLFTHRPLGALLSSVNSMEGFTNFGNTCFAAVSTWQILVSRYIYLLGASLHPQAIEGDTDTALDQNERYIFPGPGKKAIPLKKLTPEVCLTLIKNASDIKAKKLLLTDALRKCLITMENQHLKKQYSKMQKTYELLLTLCSACASDNIFMGFENFHENYVGFITTRLLQQAENRKNTESLFSQELDQDNELPVLPLNKLPPQDSAEFLAPLLKLVIPAEQLKKCAFRVLTERRIMRDSDILMITDDPRTTPVNTSGVSQIEDIVQPDTLIYSVSVSPEQAERDDLSIQMLLDDALSLKGIPDNEHQKITINCNNFRHAINNLPDPLSRAKETGTGDLLWDVLQERQVLLVEDVPEVITVQLKMLSDPCDRAKFAEKLAHDVTQDFQLTCRKASPDASLPPEDVIQRYRIVAKVFYVEDRDVRTRHYRCLINGRDRLPENDEQPVIDQVVMDDQRVFIAPQNQEDLYQLGILCMFTAEKICCG
ncbi:hypothetical protein [Endozoicomonas sp. GU-1]|uniref:hypothetical protein n=1 Tax=Endozoicomonas sp. GU-1 TaxID=3009078 RepID=UPI0022B59FFE|nr:hypothetical protein [Endozoicomonas sp. GU-1]WBA80354.1 hypothetical protein O2T12_18715 [Endozoicomonas sp. GU-1]WBA87921.1 hypothetical protein O3276_07925 [Endozoicomonas sp. GU-1]